VENMGFETSQIKEVRNRDGRHGAHKAQRQNGVSRIISIAFWLEGTSGIFFNAHNIKEPN
jgi:hypothetical protein